MTTARRNAQRGHTEPIPGEQAPTARGILDAAMSEACLQRSIEDLCDVLGTLHYHANEPRRDRPGFPDLWIPDTQAGVLRAWELKRQHGRLRPDQIRWMEALRQCERIETRVVRPSDWDWVELQLRGQTP